MYLNPLSTALFIVQTLTTPTEPLGTLRTEVNFVSQAEYDI